MAYVDTPYDKDNEFIIRIKPPFNLNYFSESNVVQKILEIYKEKLDKKSKYMYVLNKENFIGYRTFIDSYQNNNYIKDTIVYKTLSPRPVGGAATPLTFKNPPPVPTAPNLDGMVKRSYENLELYMKNFVWVTLRNIITKSKSKTDLEGFNYFINSYKQKLDKTYKKGINFTMNGKLTDKILILRSDYVTEYKNQNLLSPPSQMLIEPMNEMFLLTEREIKKKKEREREERKRKKRLEYEARERMKAIEREERKEKKLKAARKKMFKDIDNFPKRTNLDFDPSTFEDPPIPVPPGVDLDPTGSIGVASDYGSDIDILPGIETTGDDTTGIETGSIGVFSGYDSDASDVDVPPVVEPPVVEPPVDDSDNGSDASDVDVLPVVPTVVVPTVVVPPVVDAIPVVPRVVPRVVPPDDDSDDDGYGLGDDEY